ncbi:MAG: thiamine pyrophosphate-dependent enzyme [Candidatus Aenigmatarchaeota archaeon]
MNKEDLGTGAPNTWCPGCYNFMILENVKRALKDRIENTDLEQEDISMVTGIGCHGKMFDYLNVGGVYSLHGRVLPTCLGLRIGNPNQLVLGFGGDGDTYSEGMAHFIHMARFNPDITMIVHNNQVFALTTGQATPTSEEGFHSKAQPEGLIHDPINPLRVAISSGASFVARVYPKDFAHTTKVLKQAMEHDGYAVVDMAIPCLIYHQDTDFLEDNIYKLEETGHDKTDKEEAMRRVSEWDYNLKDSKIPVGVFYQERRETLAERKSQLKELQEKNMAWHETKE